MFCHALTESHIGALKSCAINDHGFTVSRIHPMRIKNWVSDMHSLTLNHILAGQPNFFLSVGTASVESDTDDSDAGSPSLPPAFYGPPTAYVSGSAAPSSPQVGSIQRVMRMSSSSLTTVASSTVSQVGQDGDKPILVWLQVHKLQLAS